MSNSPETKKKKKIKGLNDLLENNKFVLLLSLVIAFFVWVAVAMYATPEESYTIYNIPITVNTENSIVSQKGYKNFWQSTDAIDVTVTGPRYLITSLTADDILVTANLNTVDAAGISELSLKVNLVEDSQDITISAMSQTSVEIYFDTELEKVFNVTLDTAQLPEKIADGYQVESSELTVSTVVLKGPETEMNKIVSVVADPVYPEELLFETTTLAAELSLEGATASDTVSVNKYVEFVDVQEYFVKIAIDRLAELTPQVIFTGTKTGDISVRFNSNVIIAKIATEFGYDSDTLPIYTVDYADLAEGTNKFTVRVSDMELPEGVKIPDETFTFTITINYTPYE